MQRVSCSLVRYLSIVSIQLGIQLLCGKLRSVSTSPPAASETPAAASTATASTTAAASPPFKPGLTEPGTIEPFAYAANREKRVSPESVKRASLLRLQRRDPITHPCVYGRLSVNSEVTCCIFMGRPAKEKHTNDKLTS